MAPESVLHNAYQSRFGALDQADRDLRAEIGTVRSEITTRFQALEDRLWKVGVGIILCLLGIIGNAVVLARK